MGVSVDYTKLMRTLSKENRVRRGFKSHLRKFRFLQDLCCVLLCCFGLSFLCHVIPSLSQAARDGREDIVRYYLERLSEEEKEQVINARDSEGYTALHYAAKFNRFQIMVRLITHDAG